MKAILRATGERGEAYIQERSSEWMFAPYHAMNQVRLVHRSEIVLIGGVE